MRVEAAKERAKHVIAVAMADVLFGSVPTDTAFVGEVDELFDGLFFGIAVGIELVQVAFFCCVVFVFHFFVIKVGQ